MFGAAGNASAAAEDTQGLVMEDMLMVEGTHRRLPDIIRTHLVIQSITELRLVLIHLIALGGGLVWIGVIIPGLLPKSILELAEIAVPILLAFFGFYLFQELRARSQLARFLRDESPDDQPEQPGPYGREPPEGE